MIIGYGSNGGVASSLVQRAIEVMVRDGADEVTSITDVVVRDFDIAILRSCLKQSLTTWLR